MSLSLLFKSQYINQKEISKNNSLNLSDNNSSEALWLNTFKSVSVHQWIQGTCLYHVSYEEQFLKMILGLSLRYGMSD